MRRTTAIWILCALVLISTGCVDQSEIRNEPEGTPTSTSICDPEYLDGSIENCLIEERPPDLEIGNYHHAHHDVSIRITEDETTVVLSENMSLDPHEWVLLEDVITAPGVYNITVSADNATSTSSIWDFEKRYSGDGDVYRNVLITDDGEIVIQGTGPA